MEDFFYNGIWRMDWGLGNPNKTAIFIVELMIASTGLIFIEKWKKWNIWCVILANLILGCCLIHTFSRGGIVALLAGMSGTAYFILKRLKRKDVYALVGMCLLLLFFSFYLNSYKRYLSGIITEDRSITNRLTIWKRVPQMMVAAPYGWGIGESGKTFMRWYQDPERSEPYRTLVSSHFTWLVEVGWFLRFAYIALWFIVIAVCFPVSVSQWNAITLGEWLCLGTGMLFSSVGETLLLWFIPVLFLIFTIRNRWLLFHNILSGRYLKFIVILSAILCLIFFLIGKSGNQIFYDGRRTIIGKGEPSIWLVKDEEILGKYEYARYLRKSQQTSVGIVDRLADLPWNIEKASIIIAGSLDDNESWLLKTITNKFTKAILISPRFFPKEFGTYLDQTGKLSVWFGSLSQSKYQFIWGMNYKINIINGYQDFIPNWPDILNKNEKLYPFGLD